MVRQTLALALTLTTVSLSLAACESKMDPKECDKVRAKAFDIVNSAHMCNTDSDCQQSEWPGCEKPLSKKHAEEIAGLKDQFSKGKCEEKKADCRKPPPVYCKQGLCVHREAGTPENQRDEGIKIE